MISELAGRLIGTDGADFATKFDLRWATALVTQNGLGNDSIDVQIYATVLFRAVRRAFEK